jgi:Icc protein
MKIIHVTDTHLMAAGEKLHDLDPFERLRLCFKDIATHHSDADLCVLTGDLSEAGQTEAYVLLKQLLVDLPMRASLLLGNHDHRQRFCDVFTHTPKDSNGFIQWAEPTSEGVMLFLDTNAPGTDEGVYCQQRHQWLREQLAQHHDCPIYLFMHHPPFDIGIPDMDALRLRDCDTFAQTLAGHNDIRHLFFGHVHRPISGQWRGISFSALHGTNHQVPLLLDKDPANGVFAFCQEEPSYGVVLIANDMTTVHLQPFLNRPPVYYECYE